MKPQFIRAEALTFAETVRVVRWMKANGLRHYVPELAVIQVHGNHFTVDTFDIERVGQKGKRWASRRWITDSDGCRTLPIKTRTYRIRHELKDIR